MRRELRALGAMGNLIMVTVSDRPRGRWIVEGRNSPKEAFRLVAAPSYETEAEARKALDEVNDLYTREGVPFQGRVLQLDPL